jgi:hypothetical protein
MNTQKTDTPRLLSDPVLKELWMVKHRMNEQAGYDVKKLLKKADEALERFARQKHDQSRTGQDR